MGGSGSGKQMHYKTTGQMLIKYICMQKIHMKQKYQYLINKRKKVVSNHYDDPKAFVEY